MSKFNGMLESKVMPIAGKMAGQRHLQALPDSIVLDNAAHYYRFSIFNTVEFTDTRL